MGSLSPEQAFTLGKEMAAFHLAVRDERVRQIAKWGEPSYDPLYWGGILGEEVGEVHMAVMALDRAERAGTLAQVREELVQVSAVCAAWVASIDRTMREAENEQV